MHFSHSRAPLSDTLFTPSVPVFKYFKKMQFDNLQLFKTLFALCMVFRRNEAGMEARTTLRIGTYLRPMFLMKMAENGRFERYKGFVKDYCEELVNILGYQYEFILPQDYHHSASPGHTNSTISGYWNGVFGMLIRNEVDFAFGDTEVTLERAQVVDFSAPVLTTRFSLLYKLPNVTHELEADQSFWTVFKPFPVAVWIPFLILAIIYVGFLKLHRLRSNFSKFFPDSELRYSKKLAKMFLIAWTLFLFTSYISNYTAMKILKSMKSEDHGYPQSLVDVVSDKGVKIGWITRGPAERFFRNTVNELYQKIYMQNMGRDWVSTQSEGVSKVLAENGNFAIILDSLTADFETHKDCSLYKLPQEFGPVRSIAVATPIGSPLRERINQAVLSLSEQGITEALQRRWFSNTNSGCTTRKTQVNHEKENASVQEMSLVFILAIVGLFLSTMAGLLEIQFLKRKSKSATLSTLPMKAKPPRQPQQQTELLPKFNLEDV